MMNFSEISMLDDGLLLDSERNYQLETHTALHRKLQSKIEALRILRQQLEKFRTERDQFKLMAETLQLRYSAIKRSTDVSLYGLDNNVACMMHETREKNIRLTTELEALKQKVSELQGDIELLRAKEDKIRERRKSDSDHEQITAKEEARWKMERSNFICHLENLKKKNAQLAFDLKGLIDEKEELVTERDAYKCKAHRLNHELFVALNANEAHPQFLDVDSIILENKYLQERVTCLEDELDLCKQSIQKYKTMMDAKRKKGIIKLGTGGGSKDENILSHKQVKSLLESGIELPTRTETIQDLKSLCLAALDNLNDKNLALNHQKKTNKILATRIAELEQRIQKLIGTDSSSSSASTFSPTQLLLHGYCPSAVDVSVTEEAEIAIEHSKDQLEPIEEATVLSTECDESIKSFNGRAISDDALSSSTESGRSILSSEYGIECNPAPLSTLTEKAMPAYNTPSTTTDSCTGGGLLDVTTNRPLVSGSISRERIDDLKDLPPELAEMVQKALHELDMRELDERLCDNANRCQSADAYFNTQHAEDTDITR